MGEFGLRWILAALGGVILLTIYLWGMRARLREKLRERQRRAKSLSLEGQPGLVSNDTETPSPSIRDFPDMSPNHHLAEKMLVDVEITPVKRSQPERDEAAKVEQQPVKAPKPEPVATEPSHESSKNVFDEAALLDKIWEPAPATSPESGDKKKKIKQTEEVKGEEITPQTPAESASEVTETPTKTIVMTVVAPPGRPYRGSSILLAAQELRLKIHKKSGMFAYFSEEQSSPNPIFRVAHLREPGTFDLNTVGNLTTPGLLMYMQLPAPVPAVQALESMLEVADRLTQKLGGAVCNERRNKLTLQNKLQLKGEAADFDRRLQEARQ